MSRNNSNFNILTVSAAEIQRKFGFYSDEAMIRPVGVQRHGTTRLVMLSATEYERLKRRDRQVILAKDMSDDLIRQIEQSEPGEASKALGKLLDES